MNNMTKPLIIYGAGGVGRAVQQFIVDINQHTPTWKLLGFVDDRAKLHGTKIHGISVVGGLSWLRDREVTANVCVGIAKPATRKRLFRELESLSHICLPRFVHPNSWIADSVTVGHGSVVYPGVHIDPDVTVGQGVILNKTVTVGHDTTVGDFVTVAPGANIGGNVHLGAQCNVGMGASVIQQITIGSSTVIGAGAVVVSDLPSNVTAVGVPARIIKTHKP